MQENNHPSRDALSKFLDEVAKAPMMPNLDFDGMPYVETTREVLSYYLKTPASLKGFDDTGYFIFHNVKVYEVGKREALIEKLELEDRNRKYGVRLDLK